MNPFEQMELKKMSMTKKELEVCEIFTENIDDILRSTATAMAEKYHLSQPAITRFCQRLGYHGYSDFKYDVYRHYKIGDGAKDTSSVIDYYIRLIRLIPQAVSPEQFKHLASLIWSSHYISICGYHKSALPAQLLDINLGKLGILSAYVRPDRTDTLTQRIRSDNLTIFFSAASSVYRPEIDQINELPKDKRPVTVLITQSDKHPLRNKVNHVIWLPSYRNQGYTQYLESQIVPMIFVDLLTSYIADHQDAPGTAST